MAQFNSLKDGINNMVAESKADPTANVGGAKKNYEQHLNAQLNNAKGDIPQEQVAKMKERYDARKTAPSQPAKPIENKYSMLKKGDRVKAQPESFGKGELGIKKGDTYDDEYEVVGFYDKGNVVNENTAHPENKTYGLRVKNARTGNEYPTTRGYLSDPIVNKETAPVKTPTQPQKENQRQRIKTNLASLDANKDFIGVVFPTEDGKYKYQNFNDLGFIDTLDAVGEEQGEYEIYDTPNGKVAVDMSQPMKYGSEEEKQKAINDLSGIFNGRPVQQAQQPMTKDAALSKYLGENVEISGYDENVFTIGSREYYVGNEQEAHDRAIKDVMDIIDDLGIDSFTPDFQQEILNNYVDKGFIQQLIDEQVNFYEGEGETDTADFYRNMSPKEFIKDLKMNFGQKEFNNLVKDNIDWNAVAEEAVNIDGIAHFISSYDGKEIDLGNGLFAYRLN